MKKLLLLLFSVSLTFNVLGAVYDFTSGGIYYTITSAANKTVSVTYSSTSYNSYSGSVVIPSTVDNGATTYSVKGIGSKAFQQSTGLTSVTIPSSVTTIGTNAFYGCTGLTSVTIPSSVTAIGINVFYGCTGLTSVSIPSSVTSIGGSAFQGCSHLTSITIPSLVTSIGGSAFQGCSSLTSITIPSLVTSIEANVFYGCTGLTSVVIPSTIQTIGANAFYGCTTLAAVTIPPNIASIGVDAFKNCTGLTAVYSYPEPPLSLVSSIFDGVNKATCTLYVPTRTSKGNYTSADYWGEFETITPMITWDTPADIEWGTALSSANLNAAAVMAGTYSYTPASGTVLNEGDSQILDVEFSPTDTLNYFPLTEEVTINVKKMTHVWDGSSWTPSTSMTSKSDVVIAGTYGGSGFECANLTINSGKKTTLSSNLVVNDTLTLISNDGGTAQLLNNGTVTNNGVIRIRKTFKPSYGWVFFSTPYDVPAANVKIAGTNTQATWGDITDTGVDFYVQEYDGALRDATGNAAASAGLNWINVSPRTFVAGKGYIIAVASDKTLDFVSASGESSMFASTGEIPVAKHTTNATVTHNSWNLIGQPFLSSFDLANATQEQAPFYYYDGNTYQTVMSGDNYVVSPFGAFFLQDHAATDVVEYAAAGKTLKKVAAGSTFEEIPLTVSNDTYTDKTRIRLQAGSTTDYELGNDAIKMMSLKSVVPQIYTVTGGTNYSVNSLPSTTNTVNLVVTTGVAGTYTISLSDIASASDYTSILLVDGNKQTNLLDGNYTFITNGSLTKSMQLELGISYTAINEVSDTNSKVSCSGDKVTLSGLEGTANVQVYDVTGRLLQSFKTIENNQTVTLANKGVNLLEIVTTTGTTNIKVLVK